MEPSTTEQKTTQEEAAHSSQDEAVFDVEEQVGASNPTEENSESHIPPAEMEYLKSKIHVRLRREWIMVHRKRLTQVWTMRWR